MGALFHVLNHGTFKSLLFLNAGSMMYATHTQDLNKLGGLIKYMPVTAFTTIIAAASIAGVPLFNGFASKWTIYVAAIQGSAAAGYLAVCVFIAILTSAITLALMIKYFGVSFLSRASTLVTAQAAKAGKLEVGFMMKLPAILLAIVCVGVGLFPAVMFDLLHRVLNASQQGFGAVLAKANPMAGAPLTGLEVDQQHRALCSAAGRGGAWPGVPGLLHHLQTRKRPTSHCRSLALRLCA